MAGAAAASYGLLGTKRVPPPFSFSSYALSAENDPPRHAQTGCHEGGRRAALHQGRPFRVDQVARLDFVAANWPHSPTT